MARLNYEVLSCDSVCWSHAFLIRSFEERLLKLFSEGKLFGTVHTCIGQEFTGVAEKTALLREALKALIERESARRLASLEGTMPKLKHIPRRRPGTKTI